MLFDCFVVVWLGCLLRLLVCIVFWVVVLGLGWVHWWWFWVGCVVWFELFCGWMVCGGFVCYGCFVWLGFLISLYVDGYYVGWLLGCVVLFGLCFGCMVVCCGLVCCGLVLVVLSLGDLPVWVGFWLLFCFVVLVFGLCLGGGVVWFV